MKKIIFLLLCALPIALFAQKKPLDQFAYDQWESVGERIISNDGRWIVYTVNPQEGDGMLMVVSSDGTSRRAIARGYQAGITEDNQFVIFRIKPTFKATREAKIKKKKPEEMPKDSLGIIHLQNGAIKKFDRVKSFKVPENSSEWIAFQKEARVQKPEAAGSKAVDSLKKRIDSLVQAIHALKNNHDAVMMASQAVADTSRKEIAGAKGSDLILYNLRSGRQIIFTTTEEYTLDRDGDRVAIFVRNAKPDSVFYGIPLYNDDGSINFKPTIRSNFHADSAGSGGVVLYSFANNSADTILRDINEAKNFAFSEDGTQLAFVAESGKNKKALQKFYDVYLLSRTSRNQIGKALPFHHGITYSKIW